MCYMLTDSMLRHFFEVNRPYRVGCEATLITTLIEAPVKCRNPPSLKLCRTGAMYGLTRENQ
jgi:hypothetical protein